MGLPRAYATRYTECDITTIICTYIILVHNQYAILHCNNHNNPLVILHRDIYDITAISRP